MWTFENVKFEALSARRAVKMITIMFYGTYLYGFLNKIDIITYWGLWWKVYSPDQCALCEL